MQSGEIAEVVYLRSRQPKITSIVRSNSLTGALLGDRFVDQDSAGRVGCLDAAGQDGVERTDDGLRQAFTAAGR